MSCALHVVDPVKDMPCLGATIAHATDLFYTMACICTTCVWVAAKELKLSYHNGYVYMYR